MISTFLKIPHIALLAGFLFYSTGIISAGDSNIPTAENSSGVGFIQNKGQVLDVNGNKRPEVLYVSRTNDAKIFFKKDQLSFVIRKDENASDEQQPVNDESQTYIVQRIDIDFLNANTGVQLKHSGETQTRYNYYNGENLQGITNVREYSKISYENIYSNIDINYYGGTGGGLKYDFIVKPGGLVSDIKMKYTGAQGVQIEEGKLKIVTTFGNDLGEWMPRIYQNINGKIKDVEGHYEIIDEDVVAIKVGDYDKAATLIIDPWITYYGGGNWDRNNGICADAPGNVFVTGTTAGWSIPAGPGAFQQTLNGNNNAFVGKFDAQGNHLWSTYYGGSLYDYGMAVTADVNGDVAVTGWTRSSDFPVTAGAYQPAQNGGALEAFVFKLNGVSGAQAWGTFYGGTANDIGNGITSDAAGNIYIGGETQSSDFPVVAGFQAAKSAGSDAFVVKFNSAGVRQWATFYGGSGSDIGYGIKCDPTNNDVVLCGTTTSANMPTLSATQPAYAGLLDIFVVKFNSGGTRQWATFYGGSGDDGSTAAEKGTSVAIDTQGNVVVASSTSSVNFPVTAGAYQAALAGTLGYADVFVLKLNSAGARQWATFFGGWSDDKAAGIATDASGNILIGGDTYSNDLPATNCAFLTRFRGGLEDNFVANFDANGLLKCSSYLGGVRHDETDFCGHVAFANGSIYLTGQTMGGYPVTPGAFETTFAMYSNFYGFISKICANTCGDNVVTTDFSAGNTTLCVGASTNFTDLSVACDPSKSQWAWYFPGGTPSSSTLQNPTGITYSASGSYSVKLVLTTPCGKDSITKASYINVDSPVLTLSGTTDVTCNGANNGSATVSVNGGTSPYNYAWSGAGATTNSASGLSAGTFTVTVTDANGCTNTTTAAISQPAVLFVLIPIQNDITCFGGTNGSATAAAIGGTSPFNYAWSNGSLGATASGLSAGTFTVVVTDNNGCTAIKTATITEPQQVVAVPQTSVTICAGQNTLLSATATGGNGVYNFTWAPGGITGNTISVAPVVNTTYSVVATDGNGCISFPQTIQVFIGNSPITINVSRDTTICAGGSALLYATAVGGNNNYTFNWKPANVNTPTLTVTPAVTSTFTVSVSDNCGNRGDTTEITVTVNELPVVSFSSDDSTGCAPLCINFLNTTQNSASYTWIFGDGSFSSTTSNHCYVDAGNYSVSLTVTDVNGCSSSVGKNNYINVYPLPVASFTASPQTTTILNPTIQFTDQSVGATAWSWNFGNAASSTSSFQNPQFTYDETGKYTVSLTIVNEFGCTANASLDVEVKEDYVLYIPNTFSPNGDNKNDVFIPLGIGIDVDKYELRIYDRWGDQIFESRDFQLGWDGRANNGKEVVQQDVYVWKAFVTDTDGKRHRLVGHINVIR